MSLPISITFTFANQASTIPLLDLDTNFTLLANTINGIGNGTVGLSNVQITGGNLNVANTTLSGGGIPNSGFANSNVIIGNTTIALGSAATNIGNLSLANVQLVSLNVSSAAIGNSVTSSLPANVALNNASAYFDGPNVAQGSTGTWFVSGTVTLQDTTTAVFSCKLWDGTTVIDSAQAFNNQGSTPTTASLSGMITAPAANLRISVKDNNTTGVIASNLSGNSKDSTITAIRIA